MHHDGDQRDQDRDQLLTDGEERHSSSNIDEQRRFGGQVRNTTGNRARGSESGTAANSPHERASYRNRERNDDQQSHFENENEPTDLSPTEGLAGSSADTDLDSDIERGV